ncbi:hypothetical protein M422DRAFT_267726 [Sphaerobolus stellatus SS14]|uniref:Uncharacterized protein n=1 Tax=Sphaerobolus stellatus (strain SS14) TaxID=990650 RepID=A0A0C9UZT0_SPHS4|nr:hypothetical protein M422DRAFT_267726 [Sphaerobolus stellatus SS14]
MAITAHFTWKNSKQLSNVFGYSRQFLTSIFLQQGVLRFVIIFTWALESSISEKALSPWLAGFDTPLANSISVILLCRFMLQLRKFVTRDQTVPSVNIASAPGPGIRGQLRCIHEAIIEEFGDSGMDYSLETDNDALDPTGDTVPTAGIDTEIRITAEEFPWAINPVKSIPGPSVIRNAV